MEFDRLYSGCIEMFRVMHIVACVCWGSLAGSIAGLKREERGRDWFGKREGGDRRQATVPIIFGGL